jgi:hypothetical protein
VCGITKLHVFGSRVEAVPESKDRLFDRPIEYHGYCKRNSQSNSDRKEVRRMSVERVHPKDGTGAEPITSGTTTGRLWRRFFSLPGRREPSKGLSE